MHVVIPGSHLTVDLFCELFLVHQSLPLIMTLFIVKAFSLTGVLIGITHH